MEEKHRADCRLAAALMAAALLIGLVCPGVSSAHAQGKEKGKGGKTDLKGLVSDSGVMPDRGPRPQPDLIRAELERVEKEFPGLPELKRLPEFLTAKALVDLVPEEFDKERFLDELEGKPARGISGAWLDSGKSLYVVRLHYGAVENSVAIFDAGGKLRDAVHFDWRTRVRTAGDAAGDDKNEIIVDVVGGSSLTFYPAHWHVYTTTEGGFLHEIASIPQSHHFLHNGREDAYCFMNRIAIPAKGSMTVETIWFSDPCLNSCRSDHGNLIGARDYNAKEGDKMEFRYDKDSQRFVRK